MKHASLLAFASALLLATAARAGGAEFDAAIGKTGIGRCHMDECSFFSIQTSLPLAVRKDGTLFAISELTWTSEYKAHGDDDRHEYDRAPVSTSAKEPRAFVVFCSKTRPYQFYYDDGKWEAFALRPGDEAALSGAAESAYSSYWATCHHYLPKSVYEVGKMAAKLGYHFAGGSPEGGPGDRIKQPSDLLR